MIIHLLFVVFEIQATTFSGLEAYWNYTFSVVAATEKVKSEQSEMTAIFTTKQAGELIVFCNQTNLKTYQNVIIYV